MRPDWFPDWSGEACVIVASGPSADRVPVELARGRARVIAINNSWRLAPWADALYGCDVRWWRRENGVPEFHGLKISQEIKAQEIKGWNIRVIQADRNRSNIITDRPGCVGWGGTKGGNGGFHCCNLAVQFGCRFLILVGFDMRIDLGVHWHGRHADGLNNPSQTTIEKWRAHLDSLAGRFAELGVKVVNCSDVSALTAYPKMSLAEALNLEASLGRAAA